VGKIYKQIADEMKRPFKPMQEAMISHGLYPDEIHRIRNAMDEWTQFIASRMTVKEMHTWGGSHRWGGDNPYIHGSRKDELARTIAMMILVDRLEEPEALKCP
jgi:hypothetical protein